MIIKNVIMNLALVAFSAWLCYHFDTLLGMLPLLCLFSTSYETKTSSKGDKKDEPK
jgi:hypothetical protein